MSRERQAAPPPATPLPAELVRTTECEGGPLLVRGARTVVDAHGVSHAVTRPVVALCRCGASQRLPWCDGVHKRLPAALRDQGLTDLDGHRGNSVSLGSPRRHGVDGQDREERST